MASTSEQAKTGEHPQPPQQQIQPHPPPPQVAHPPAIAPYPPYNGAPYPPMPPGAYPPYYFPAPVPVEGHDPNQPNGVPPPPYYMAYPPPPPGMVYAYPAPPPGQAIPGYPPYVQAAPMPTIVPRPKRKQVKMACTNCASACKRCDDARPCERCVKYGLADTCVDGIRKERKKGIKRGPYKRKNKQASNGESSSSPQATAIQPPPSQPEGPEIPIQPMPYAISPEGYYQYYYPGFAPPPPMPQTQPQSADQSQQQASGSAPNGTEHANGVPPQAAPPPQVINGHPVAHAPYYPVPYPPYTFSHPSVQYPQHMLQAPVPGPPPVAQQHAPPQPTTVQPDQTTASGDDASRGKKRARANTASAPPNGSESPSKNKRPKATHVPEPGQGGVDPAHTITNGHVQPQG
ncbi:hypothetical protein K474DRAFT_1706371 [Panus rudis PR-1116 ss-1]|nr:hypothetical protein K474DRAFT_1706371 [Panus rudis PR-1116 ss-1]